MEKNALDKKERYAQVKQQEAETRKASAARLNTPGSRELQRIIGQVPPRLQFSDLLARQPYHRMPDVLTFAFLRDAADTLQEAFCAPMHASLYGRLGPRWRPSTA